MIRIHGEQRSKERFRWTFSVSDTDKDSVLTQLRAHKVAVYDSSLRGEAMAILFLPFEIYFDTVREISSIVETPVNVMRESSK